MRERERVNNNNNNKCLQGGLFQYKMCTYRSSLHLQLSLSLLLLTTTSYYMHLIVNRAIKIASG